MGGRGGKNCPLLMTVSIEFLQKLNISVVHCLQFPFLPDTLAQNEETKNRRDQMTPQSHTASEWQGRTPTQVRPTSNPKAFPQKHPQLKHYLYHRGLSGKLPLKFAHFFMQIPSITSDTSSNIPSLHDLALAQFVSKVWTGKDLWVQLKSVRRTKKSSIILIPFRLLFAPRAYLLCNTMVTAASSQLSTANCQLPKVALLMSSSHDFLRPMKCKQKCHGPHATEEASKASELFSGSTLSLFPLS